jgi:dimethylhistidine N-methyltransferase
MRWIAPGKKPMTQPMTEFQTDLLRCLANRPHHISPKWFYDTRGSQLFEQICELPEYYPTRTEMALLARHASDIAGLIGPEAEVVEFGAGASRKVRLLLDALESPTRYVPIDISGEHLLACASALKADYPALDVLPVVADFTHGVELPERVGRRVGFFPGSSIGNFEPDHARQMLKEFAAQLTGGCLLIGVDLLKEPHILHAAYNDSAGVTAAFNLNLWTRSNREAGADFNTSQWAHSAFYNAPLQRIEMHLVSRCAQQVRVAGRSFRFDEGDSVHTENSHKYSIKGFQDLACSAGWTPQSVWTDPAQSFSIHLLRCDQR